MPSPYGFTALDLFALGLFFVIWIGHSYLINHSRFSPLTITSAMVSMREQWLRNVIARDGSPFDALIQNGLQQGVLFFGSTSVLLIGGVAAGLGSADSAVAILQELPLSTTSSRFQWEAKILLIVFIFVFAFFKFAWSYRLYNYILIMIGAAPRPDEDAAVVDLYARKLHVACSGGAAFHHRIELLLLCAGRVYLVSQCLVVHAGNRMGRLRSVPACVSFQFSENLQNDRTVMHR